MAHEYLGRNICVNYNFEDEPDTATLHNIDRRFWYAFETGLAMRLVADFGKEIPQALLMNHQAAFSFLSGATARPQLVNYPTRMPIGRGNKRIWNKFRRFFPNTAEPDTSCDISKIMYIDDIKDFVESFAAFLAENEDLTSYTLDVDDGLEVISESFSSPDVTYRLKAITGGIQNIKIVGTAQTDDVDYIEDCTFRADYETTFNATFGLGDNEGTAAGGATLTDGTLDLTSGTGKYIQYSGVANMPNGNIACIRINWIPNYSGSPLSNNTIFFSAVSISDLDNMIFIFHDTFGRLCYRAYDQDGNTIIDVQELIAVTSGTAYEIELNLDYDTGSNLLFLDGNLLNTDTTLANATNRDVIYIGDVFSTGIDCYIEEVTIFDAIQHTAPYTATGTTEPEPNVRVETRIKQIQVIEAPL